MLNINEIDLLIQNCPLVSEGSSAAREDIQDWVDKVGRKFDKSHFTYQVYFIEKLFKCYLNEGLTIPDGLIGSLIQQLSLITLERDCYIALKEFHKVDENLLNRLEKKLRKANSNEQSFFVERLSAHLSEEGKEYKRHTTPEFIEESNDNKNILAMGLTYEEVYLSLFKNRNKREVAEKLNKAIKQSADTSGGFLDYLILEQDKDLILREESLKESNQSREVSLLNLRRFVTDHPEKYVKQYLFSVCKQKETPITAEFLHALAASKGSKLTLWEKIESPFTAQDYFYRLHSEFSPSTPSNTEAKFELSINISGQVSTLRKNPAYIPYVHLKNSVKVNTTLMNRITKQIQNRAKRRGEKINKSYSFYFAFESVLGQIQDLSSKPRSSRDSITEIYSNLYELLNQAPEATKLYLIRRINKDLTPKQYEALSLALLSFDLSESARENCAFDNKSISGMLISHHLTKVVKLYCDNWSDYRSTNIYDVFEQAILHENVSLGGLPQDKLIEKTFQKFYRHFKRISDKDKREIKKEASDFVDKQAIDNTTWHLLNFIRSAIENNLRLSNSTLQHINKQCSKLHRLLSEESRSAFIKDSISWWLNGQHGNRPVRRLLNHTLYNTPTEAERLCLDAYYKKEVFDFISQLTLHDDQSKILKDLGFLEVMLDDNIFVNFHSAAIKEIILRKKINVALCSLLTAQCEYLEKSDYADQLEQMEEDHIDKMCKQYEYEIHGSSDFLSRSEKEKEVQRYRSIIRNMLDSARSNQEGISESRTHTQQQIILTGMQIKLREEKSILEDNEAKLLEHIKKEKEKRTALQIEWVLPKLLKLAKSVSSPSLPLTDASHSSMPSSDFSNLINFVAFIEEEMKIVNNAKDYIERLMLMRGISYCFSDEDEEKYQQFKNKVWGMPADKFHQLDNGEIKIFYEAQKEKLWIKLLENYLPRVSANTVSEGRSLLSQALLKEGGKPAVCLLMRYGALIAEIDGQRDVPHTLIVAKKDRQIFEASQDWSVWHTDYAESTKDIIELLQDYLRFIRSQDRYVHSMYGKNLLRSCLKEMLQRQRAELNEFKSDYLELSNEGIVSSTSKSLRRLIKPGMSFDNQQFERDIKLSEWALDAIERAINKAPYDPNDDLLAQVLAEWQPILAEIGFLEKTYSTVKKLLTRYDRKEIGVPYNDRYYQEGLSILNELYRRHARRIASLELRNTLRLSHAEHNSEAQEELRRSEEEADSLRQRVKKLELEKAEMAQAAQRDLEEQEEKAKKKLLEQEEKAKKELLEREEKAKKELLEEKEKAKKNLLEQEEKAKKDSLEQEKAKKELLEQVEKAKKELLEREEKAKKELLEEKERSKNQLRKLEQSFLKRQQEWEQKIEEHQQTKYQEQQQTINELRNMVQELIQSKPASTATPADAVAIAIASTSEENVSGLKLLEGVSINRPAQVGRVSPRQENSLFSSGKIAEPDQMDEKRVEGMKQG